MSSLVRMVRADWLGLLVILTSGGNCFADLITNLVPMADTGLWEAQPDNNLGGMSYVPLGVTGPQGGFLRGRALFRFQIGGPVPLNATIISAALNVPAPFGRAPGLSYELHRMLKDWGEGSGAGGGAGTGFHGALAKTNEATWKARLFSAASWATPGAAAGTDYVKAASATATMNIGETNVFTSPLLTADIRMWFSDAGTNFGWILMQSDETFLGAGLRIGTREDPVNSPVLTVVYTVPVPLTISHAAVAGNNFQFSFNANSNRTYIVEFRGSFPGTNWSVLTNIPPLSVPVAVGVTERLVLSNRFYRIRAP